MKELIWMNGVVSELAGATVSVEDRGNVFADGVYEVARVYDGVPFTLKEHLERMKRSAEEGIRLRFPMSVAEMSKEIRGLIEQSGLKRGLVYAQLTRGAGPRNHVFAPGMEPVLFFFTRELPAVPAPGTADGVKLITVEDERWKRCWIKSIALLPNVLAKNQAVEAGADEAVFVENGVVTECSVSNLFAVVKGTLVTHPVGAKVLPGITRSVVLSVAREVGVPVEERPLTVGECEGAEELFITSTTRELGWVSTWNGRAVAGTCGPVTLKLHKAFQERVRTEVEAGKREAQLVAAK